MGFLQNQSLCENVNDSSCGDFGDKGKASVTCILPPGCGSNIPYINVLAPLGDKENIEADRSSMEVAQSESENVSELVNISVLQQLVKNIVESEIKGSLDVLVKNALTETCRATGLDLSSIMDQKLRENMAVETSHNLSGVENSASTLVSKDISDIGSSSDGMMKNVTNHYALIDGHVDKKIEPVLEVDFARKGKISDNFATKVTDKSLRENKFPRRRITLERIFPPFCGRNAPRPTEEERLEITSRNNSKVVELKGIAARDLYSKRRILEDVPRPFKKTARIADSGSNLVRERASTDMMSNLVSHGNPSSTIKGAFGNNLVREKVTADLKNNLGYHLKPLNSIKLDPINNVERERVRADTKKNLVTHVNPSNAITGDSSNNLEKESARDNMTINLVSYGKLLKSIKGDSVNDLEKERARADAKKNFVSHGIPTSSTKSVQNIDFSSKAREKVKATLSLFRAICEELSQKDAAKVGKQEKGIRRVDLKAMMMIRDQGKEVNTERQRIGEVPGVEVGDEFLYRVELVIIGIHKQTQAGIDYMTRGSVTVATSIIASNTEGYIDNLGNSEVLIYSGHGGNGRKNEPHEDQKLERGNLALKNSILAKNSVRVTRGFVKTGNSGANQRARIVTYTYDGLYTVERYWSETGPHGKLVYKFELRRIAGQPKVAWKRSEVKDREW